MPDLGPGGRSGARRRTRRRMAAMNEINKPEELTRDTETPIASDNSDKSKQLAKLLRNKGVITEEEYDLLFK
ncbi:hypothetical protein [Methanobacterium sp. ACI-7]|uniref:hypothetical protein n=1 Tax=unclassified Methanobacterium TaxID=2627676 RepID=UPI0039C40EE9